MHDGNLTINFKFSQLADKNGIVDERELVPEEKIRLLMSLPVTDEVYQFMGLMFDEDE